MIEFEAPYEFYTLQKRYIELIRQTFEKGGITLIEAGTGFGKTIANLFGALPPVKNSLSSSRQLLYLSKTHVQNQQIVSELKKLNSVNLEHLTTGIQMASRVQLCHIPEVKNAPSGIASEMCRLNREKRKKSDGKRYNGCVSAVDLAKQKIVRLKIPAVISIDDMREVAENAGGCAYFTAKDLLPEYDVVSGHYFYIVSENVREAIGLSNSELNVIFDEGHNLEDVCCSLLTRTITEYILAHAQEEIRLLKIFRLEDFLDRFKECMDVLKTQKGKDKREQEPMSTHEFIQHLNSHRLSETEIKEFKVEYLIKRDELIKKLRRNDRRKEYLVTNTDRLTDFLLMIHRSPNDFGVVLDRSRRYFRIRLVCLNPALLFRQIADSAHAIVICSGTLSPLKLTAEVLGIKHFQQEVFGAITKPAFVKIVVVPRSSSGGQLSSKYELRKTDPYLFDSYRQAILECAALSPSGTLVFYPSYAFQRDVALPAKIPGTKTRIYEEPRDTVVAKMVLDDYFAEMDQGSGKAVLSAVFGGKFSEGADFPGHYARMVIIIGVPFAPVNDPSIILKKTFYEKQRPGLGKEWYTSIAFRRVIQALGRGWRGERDYSCGVLLDERYLWPRYRQQFPRWMRNRFSIPESWNEVENELQDFYRINQRMED